MKRSPLKRYTRLQSRSSLRSTAGLKRTGIARVSRKVRKLSPARIACIAETRRRADGLCQVCPLIGGRIARRCCIAGSQCHEVKSRAQGGSIIDPDNCRWTCPVGHGWIHRNPKKAAALGLLISKKYPQEQSGVAA